MKNSQKKLNKAKKYSKKNLKSALLYLKTLFYRNPTPFCEYCLNKQKGKKN